MANIAKQKSYHHGSLRETLVSGGLELIREDGVNAISLRAVARKAGVSQTAPYRHFPDKEALLAAIAAQGCALLTERLRKVAQEQDTAEAAIIEVARNYLAFSREQSALFQLIFSPDIRDKFCEAELIDKGEDLYAILMELAGDLINERRALKLDLPSVTAALWSMIHGLTQLSSHKYLEGSPSSQAAQVETIMALLLKGITP